MSAVIRTFAIALALLLPAQVAFSGATDAVTVTLPDDLDGAISVPAGRSIAELGVDYTLDEYFIAGEANVYTYAEVPVPGELTLKTSDVPYKTRILVRKPTDPADFNGTLIIEWLNSTANFDTSPTWHASAEYFTREGWIYVGVTNSSQVLPQMTGGCRLLGIFPPDLCGTRYTSLSIDNGAAYEMVSQIANLLKGTELNNPLFPDYSVDRLYHAGQSQQGGSMVTYATAFHVPGVNDGYFVQAAGSARPINFDTPCEDGGAPPYPTCTPTLQGADRRVATDQVVPVFRVQTETDMDGVLGGDTRQTDATNFRYYETAGTAHVTIHTGPALIPTGLALLPLDDPLFLEETCGLPLNTLADGPVFGAYLYNAMWDNLETQVIGATAPPSGDLLATTSPTELERDGFGNAVGGIRLPIMDLPLATYGPHNIINPDLVGTLLEPLGGLFCVLAATAEPFDEKTIKTTYPKFADYVAEYNTKIDDLLAGKFLLTEDADKLRLFAEDKAQRKCLAGIAKGMAKVAKAQRKVIRGCVKDHAKEKLELANIEACLASDPKGKIGAAEDKNTAAALANCTTAPDFGATDVAAVNAATKAVELAAFDSVFGTDADLILFDKTTGDDEADCQQEAVKIMGKCSDRRFKAFVGCQKKGLSKARVNNDTSLGACIFDDPKGKVADTCNFKLKGRLQSCISFAVADVFAGDCGTVDTLNDLRECAGSTGGCQTCAMLNTVNGTDRNCDKADDSLQNESCLL